MESVIPEGTHPEDAHTAARQTLVKQATIWLRIDGLLERLQTVAKHMAALATKMENRVPRGPPDYEMGHPPGIYVRYDGNPDPPPTREPSWQNSLLGKIVAPLIVWMIPAILVTILALYSKVSDMQGDSRLLAQKQEQMEKHLEATDRDVAEIKQDLWPHRH